MKYSIIAAFILFLAFTARAQTCPTGFICLTQEQANIARENALELAATKEKVQTLTEAVAAEKKNTEETKATAARNEADLKRVIAETEIKLATATGQLIEAKAANVEQRAIIQFLLTNGRKKCGVLSLCIQ